MTYTLNVNLHANGRIDADTLTRLREHIETVLEAVVEAMNLEVVVQPATIEWEEVTGE